MDTARIQRNQSESELVSGVSLKTRMCRSITFLAFRDLRFLRRRHSGVKGSRIATVVGCLLLKGGMMALARFMYRESGAAEDPVGKGQDL
jgi:hypothetical protein